MATSVSGYADTVQNEMTKGASLLVGQGGEARIALMRKMVNHADGGANHFKSTATAADSFRAIVSGLKTDLSRVADAHAHIARAGVHLDLDVVGRLSADAVDEPSAAARRGR